jgi:hypothetical protein
MQRNGHYIAFAIAPIIFVFSLNNYFCVFFKQLQIKEKEKKMHAEAWFPDCSLKHPP